MLHRASMVLGVFVGLALVPGAVLAQGYDPDFGGPPPFRRPLPPPYDYRAPPPPLPYGYGYGRPPLVCRTEEGSCRTRAPQAYRARCLCDFGYGPVPGRMKP